MTGDIVVTPQLRCQVAEEAQRAWHSYIKNGFLFHTDRVLAEWIRDEPRLREFEDCVDWVCRNISGFSAGQLVRDLRPLEELAPEDGQRLVKALDDAFAREFRPGEVAQQLRKRLNELLRLVSDFAPPDSGQGERTQTLGAIRDAARALWRELEALPGGFWLTRRSLGTAAVSGT